MSETSVHNRELYEMCRAHFNEPMIAMERVVRCIGYGETAVDCYVISQSMGGKVTWHTCVGGYFWLDRLKGQDYVRSTGGEDWDDLYRLDNVLALNGAPKADAFRLELRHDDLEDYRAAQKGEDDGRA